ncbi:hypothetical protein L4X63_07220 [Geomonas sp. Red32]|uniref:glycosyltransferase n=1 Tax=Geomonas sp. Red32 TaxID=2912856 RepID=UPI00202CCCBC|nr:glycosyltransferase [Geomonas sp. Red32]MCM0081377.1 hypothetical protein [Geomonas sp. Red32]
MTGSLPRYRILMFAPAFAPFANPEAIVNSKLALAFLQAGWEVDVVTRDLAAESSYNYGSQWIDPWLPLKERTYFVTYPAGGRLARFCDTAVSMLKVGSGLEGCRWAAHALETGLRLHRAKPYQVVLSRSLPDSGHLPGLAFARRTGIPWVANWNDATGEKNLAPYGKGAAGKLRFFEERLLREVSNRADLLTFPSERLRRHVCGYLPSSSTSKSTVVRHAALSGTPAPTAGSERFVLCHAGHLSRFRRPELFLEGLSDFLATLADPSDVRFDIIGIQDEDLMKVAETFGIGRHLNFIGCLSYRETLEKLAQSTVNVIVEAGIEEGIYLPAKFVDYVQAGRPILAIMPPQGEVGDLLNQHGGGIAVDCTSREKIAQALGDLYRRYLTGELLNTFGPGCLYPLHAPETITETYGGIFARLLNGRGA